MVKLLLLWSVSNGQHFFYHIQSQSFMSVMIVYHQVKYMAFKCFPFFLLFYLNIQDIEGDNIQRDMQKTTMGIYIINKEGWENGHYDDIGIFVDGVIIMDNIGGAARACALME